MSPLHTIRGRLADWRRERRIRSLGKQAGKALRGNQRSEARRLWALIAAEIKQRSPQQIARMERAMGLHE